MNRSGPLCTLQIAGGGGGEVGSGRGRSEGAELEGENKRGGGAFQFFGPQMALAYRLDAISKGPKNSRIPGPNPIPLVLAMDMHASKTLSTGLYK
jgi:hypothetical protein